MIFPGDMHWAYIHYALVMRVGESLIRKHQPAQNNQQNPNPNDRFNISTSLLNHPPSALNQIYEEDGQRHEQKDVDESPERIGCDHAEKPKDT
jgi:hypothetical protein